MMTTILVLPNKHSHIEDHLAEHRGCLRWEGAWRRARERGDGGLSRCWHRRRVRREGRRGGRRGRRERRRRERRSISDLTSHISHLTSHISHLTSQK